MSDNHFHAHTHVTNEIPKILNLLFKPVTSLVPSLEKKLPHALTEHLSLGSLLLVHPFIVEPISHMVTKTVQAGIDYAKGYPVDNPFTKDNILKSFHLRFDAPKTKLESFNKVAEAPRIESALPPAQDMSDAMKNTKIKIDLQANPSSQKKVLLSNPHDKLKV